MYCLCRRIRSLNANMGNNGHPHATAVPLADTAANPSKADGMGQAQLAWCGQAEPTQNWVFCGRIAPPHVQRLRSAAVMSVSEISPAVRARSV